MANVKGYIKRLIRYVVKGQPQVNVSVNISQINYGNILLNKNILITGGSRGLGFEIAKKCISEGANVIITGKNKKTLDAAKKELGSERCQTILFDISKINEIDKNLEQCFNLFGGKIDCLINNAGISLHEGDYSKVTEKDWDDQFDTNLKGLYFLTNKFIEKYKFYNQNSAKIIMMASERGLYGDDLPYGLTKAALISYTKGLAKKVIEYGIRVNAIAPGVVATDMTSYKKEQNLYRDTSLGKRVLIPEEIAEVVLFMISDASNCISGEVISCNEGNHLR